MTDFERLIVGPSVSIRDVMRTIDRGAEALALVVTGGGILVGTVSDGDVRRALLDGASLEDSISPFVSRNPVTVRQGYDRSAVLDIMRAQRLNHIPVVDSEGVLIGLHVVREVLGGEPKVNWAVVLAGGRGTRLGGLTATTPKPMLPVAGRPILERIVHHLVGSGISKVYLSVAYLSGQIREHFGDGSDFGCSIMYLEEDQGNPLGTGGPLRALLEQDVRPQHPLLVMNGDLITSFSVSDILQHHDRARAAVTVALREHVHEVPFGVARIDESDPAAIVELVEKPRWSGLVNAGIYVIEPRLLARIPEGVHFPMTELIESCIDRGEKVAGWHLTDEWHDIGRPSEFARARGEG